jgi:uncharacterized protein YfdQ (DUF2303 family)
MPSSTPSYYVPNSEAHDLGVQFRALLAAESITVEHPLTGAKVPALVLPDGRTLTSVKPMLDAYLQKPERRTGTASLSDVQSFVDHITRFKSDSTVVFASPDPLRPDLVCVYDYYPKGPDNTATDWLMHRGHYAPALAASWRAWSGKHATTFSQAEFASFIEEHIQDVIVPNLDDPNLVTFATLVAGRFAEPSDLLALSRSLTVNVETTVKNAVQLSTGQISVTYEEQHKDGEGHPIDVPNLFQICVPVFYGGALYRIAARLRFRLSNHKILWSFLLVRPDLVFDSAFKGIVSTVVEQTGVPVMLGAPEELD